MEARRQFHGHHGRHGGSSGGGRGSGRFRGGGGRGGGGGGPPGRPALWFKGDGYNDYEVVSIAEEVVGISGFLDERQPGFSGVLKQRFSDFVVHEISPSGRRVQLQVLAKKPKGATTAFQHLVLAFLLGDAAGDDQDTEKKDKKPASATEVVLRVLGRKLQRAGSDNGKRAHAAQERYNLRRLVMLVAKEIGPKKGKEFEEFLAKVEEARAKFDAERKEYASGSAAKATATAATSVASGDRTSAALAAAAASEGLTFYVGGLNDKADRVFIHESMRRYGSSRIVADTLNIGGDTSVIRVRPAFATKLIPGERDSRRDWPVGQPDYLQFTLYKRNKDTSVVLNQLAAALKVPASLFSYADAKDKRGISTQLCTVYRVTKERAQQVFKPAPLRALDDQAHLVGDLRFTHHKLQLGDCRGNHIAVAIRSLPNEDVLPENQVGDSVAAWKTHGFINFFGLPRFGTTGPTSYHLIGRAMLRKDFKLAVLLLLRPQEGEASKIREAREHFRQHKDVAAALRMLPPFLVAERAILEGLQQNGIEAHELAFRNVPKPIRVAYVEAYQHYVWNEMASLRMSKECDSTAAMVGDLVLVSSSSEDDGSGPPKKKYKKALTKRVVRQAVATLTAESVAQYSIDDVVLPVPGHAVVYPDNAVGAAYRKMLATDGIDMSAHFEPDGSQQFALDGYYRHVVQKPTSVSFRLARYDDPTVPLIETDVDRLLKKCSADGNDSSDRKSDEKGGEDKRPAHRALVLEFELGYGSDATVALRELMKQSSSVHVSWQQGGSSDFVATENGSSASTTAEKNVGESAAKASTATEKPAKKTKKLAKSEPRKVITAQKKTQVAIGRPGFSLGRS